MAIDWGDVEAQARREAAALLRMRERSRDEQAGAAAPLQKANENEKRKEAKVKVQSEGYHGDLKGKVKVASKVEVDGKGKVASKVKAANRAKADGQVKVASKKVGGKVKAAAKKLQKKRGRKKKVAVDGDIMCKDVGSWPSPAIREKVNWDDVQAQAKKQALTLVERRKRDADPENGSSLLVHAAKKVKRSTFTSFLEQAGLKKKKVKKRKPMDGAGSLQQRSPKISDAQPLQQLAADRSAATVCNITENIGADVRPLAAQRRLRRPRVKRVYSVHSDEEDMPETFNWKELEQSAKTHAAILLAERQLDSSAAPYSHWVRRSERSSGRSALNLNLTKKLLHLIKTNDKECEVLKLHHYLSPDVNSEVIDAVLDALMVNENCEALYLQNFSQGVREPQLIKLIEVLRLGRIWSINLGENYEISLDAWWQFCRDLNDTNVTHAYLSEHVIEASLKNEIRRVIRMNRKKHDRHCNIGNLSIISRVTNCWWNPRNSRRLRESMAQLGVEVPTKWDHADITLAPTEEEAKLSQPPGCDLRASPLLQENDTENAIAQGKTGKNSCECDLQWQGAAIPNSRNGASGLGAADQELPHQIQSSVGDDVQQSANRAIPVVKEPCSPFCGNQQDETRKATNLATILEPSTVVPGAASVEEMQKSTGEKCLQVGT